MQYDIPLVLSGIDKEYYGDSSSFAGGRKPQLCPFVHISGTD